MKIVQLKCTACGANLPVAAPGAEAVICEHCGTAYMIDREKDTKKPPQNPRTPAGKKNSSLGSNTHPPKSKQAQADAQKAAREKERQRKENAKKQKSRYMLAFVLVAAGIIIFSALFLPEKQNTSSISNERTLPQSEVMRAFVGYIFQKSPESVTKEEYASLQYLVIDSGRSINEYISFKYSFENPLEGEVTPEEYIFEYSSSTDIKDIADPYDLQCFKGLKLLHLNRIDDSNLTLRSLSDLQYFKDNSFRSPNELKEMFANPEGMKSVSCYFGSEADIAKCIDFFPQLTELNISTNSSEVPLDKLRELSKLKSLKKIVLQAEEDMMWLTALAGITELELDFCNDMDYTFLYSMPNLERLKMDRAIKLKDLSFVANMPRLQHLSISSGEYSLEPLRGRTSITSLELEYTYDLQGVDTLATLSSLQSLKMPQSFSAESLPDLSGLRYLTYAHVEHKALSAVINSPYIKTLHIRNGDINIPELAGMSSLETLILDDATPKDIEALHTLKSLKCLEISAVDIRASSHYKDGIDYDVEGDHDKSSDTGDGIIITNTTEALFNHPTLERLIIKSADISFEIKDIEPNETLKALIINNVGFRINATVLSADMLEPVFLSLVELEELTLIKTKLRSLEPLKNMSKLRILNIYDNYLSDISPLTKLDSLSVCIYGENPVANPSGLSSKVYCAKT